MPNLVNFKNAYRERVNGPEEREAVYRTHWTTGRHGGFSWSGLVAELQSPQLHRHLRSAGRILRSGRPAAAHGRRRPALPRVGRRLSARPRRRGLGGTEGGDGNGYKSKARICIIGAGNHGEQRALSLARLVRRRRDRGGHRDPGRPAQGNLRQVRRSPRSARFLAGLDTDYQKVLKDLAPDGVYVIGQPEIMYPIWHWCLTQGFNLYIEKPMGLNTHQAESLALPRREQGSHHPGQPSAADVADPAAGEGAPPREGAGYPRRRRVLQMRHRADARRARPHDGRRHPCRRHRPLDMRRRGRESRKPSPAVSACPTSTISARRCTSTTARPATCLQLGLGAARLPHSDPRGQGGYADVEVEAEARIYLDNNYKGETLTTHEAAGSDKNYVFGGFAAKNREFIEFTQDWHRRVLLAVSRYGEDDAGLRDDTGAGHGPTA